MGLGEREHPARREAGAAGGREAGSAAGGCRQEGRVAPARADGACLSCYSCSVTCFQKHKGKEDP